MGMDLRPVDLIHADRHGGVVIPPEVMDQLQAAILKVQVTEKLVLDPACQEGFDFAAFETAWAAFEMA